MIARQYLRLPDLRTLGLLAVMLVTLAACASPGTITNESLPDTATAEDVAGTELPRNADGYVDVTADQLAAMLDEDNLTLVNVHIPYGGELPETDLFIPFNEISQHTDELPDQDAPIVLYCRSGSMSTQAAKELAALGYTNIFELDGGFKAWQAAGHELVVE